MKLISHSVGKQLCGDTGATSWTSPSSPSVPLTIGSSEKTLAVDVRMSHGLENILAVSAMMSSGNEINRLSDLTKLKTGTLKSSMNAETLIHNIRQIMFRGYSLTPSMKRANSHSLTMGTGGLAAWLPLLFLLNRDSQEWRPLLSNLNIRLDDITLFNAATKTEYGHQ